MTLYFELTSAQGTPARMALQPGVQRIKAAVGDRYRIYDEATGKTPADIVVKRLDSHMIIEGLPNDASVELTDFYARCGVSSPCTFVVESPGVFSAGPVEITPASPPLQALTDGSFVVYPSGYSGAAAIATADSEGFPAGTGYVVGGLALVALAGAGGGGGGGDDSPAPTAVSPIPGPVPGAAPAPPGAIDVTPPDFPEVTSEKTSTSRTPTIAGRAEAGATVQVQVDTNRDGSAEASFVTIANASGQWQVDLGSQAPQSGALPPAGLPERSATLVTVTAIDSSQNQSGATQFELLVGGVPPQTIAAVTTVTDNVAPRTGNVGNGGATNDDSPTIAGTLSTPLAAGETVQVLRDGAVIGATVVVDGQTWRVTDSRVADGAHTYSARVVDADGAGPVGSGFSIVVDTQNAKTAAIASINDDVAPDVGIIRDGGTTNDNTPTLNGRLSSSLEAGEELQVLRNGAVISNSPQVNGAGWTFTDAPLANGSYDYTVRVVDAAGNVGRASSVYDVRVSRLGGILPFEQQAEAADDGAAVALGFDEVLSSSATAPAGLEPTAGPPAATAAGGSAADTYGASLSLYAIGGIDSLLNPELLA
jgi:hypothetical protein